LQVAALFGHYEILQFLLEGADHSDLLVSPTQKRQTLPGLIEWNREDLEDALKPAYFSSHSVYNLLENYIEA